MLVKPQAFVIHSTFSQGQIVEKLVMGMLGFSNKYHLNKYQDANKYCLLNVAKPNDSFETYYRT